MLIVVPFCEIAQQLECFDLGELGLEEFVDRDVQFDSIKNVSRFRAVHSTQMKVVCDNAVDVPVILDSQTRIYLAFDADLELVWALYWPCTLDYLI